VHKILHKILEKGRETISTLRSVEGKSSAGRFSRLRVNLKTICVHLRHLRINSREEPSGFGLYLNGIGV
jgi:hypothetical protein